MVLQMFELDFAERENGIVLPKEEKWNRTSQRRSSVPEEDGICYRCDMHHEMPLLREENFQLPNDRLQAVQRLHGLKKRLQGDPKYHADYTTF